LFERISWETAAALVSILPVSSMSAETIDTTLPFSAMPKIPRCLPAGRVRDLSM
jgi:hypothetical protein